MIHSGTNHVKAIKIMWSKQKLNRLTFWGIMMATMGVPVFKDSIVGNLVCFAGLALLIAIKVLLWRNKRRVSR